MNDIELNMTLEEARAILEEERQRQQRLVDAQTVIARHQRQQQQQYQAADTNRYINRQQAAAIEAQARAMESAQNARPTAAMQQQLDEQARVQERDRVRALVYGTDNG